MEELKQVHKNDGSERQEIYEQQDSDGETPSACEDDLDSAPPNRAVSHLVQQCCDLVVQWRSSTLPSNQLSDSQRHQLDKIVSELLDCLFYQNSQELLLQSQQEGVSLETMQSLLAQKRESKFSNRLTYDLPLTEEQCKREHTAVKDLIRTHNKWLMRHQIKHKIREVQDRLQKIKICHANRRRQRIHRHNKRRRTNPSQAPGEDFPLE